MLIAVPKFNDEIAPCFEVAGCFLVSTVEEGTEISHKIYPCEGCEGYGRIQFIRAKKINVLICNGIKGFYRDLLQASGVTVISNVCDTVTGAIQKYVSGSLVSDSEPIEPAETDDLIPLEDLVCWTRELFEANGYSVKSRKGEAPFPIDLIAEINCPLCHKPVRVAICCGAHMYRSDQEIAQLHRIATTNYHARVYVHSYSSQIVRFCKEYGVELIDPDAGIHDTERPLKSKIPILQGIIDGHEKASGSHASERSESKE